MEKKEMEEKNPSFRGIMTEFMGYTTGHGFSRLIAATSIVWRIFWVLAVIGAFGMFVFEVIQLFKLFLSRPVQTSVSVTFEKQLEFPAVTICNLNMVKKSAMTYLPDDLLESFPVNISYYELPGDGKGAFNISENSTDSYIPGDNKNAFNISESSTDSHFKAQPTTAQSTAKISTAAAKNRRKRGALDGKDPSSYGSTQAPLDSKGDDGSYGDTGAKDDYWEEDWKKDDYYDDISDEYPDATKVDKETKLRMMVEFYIGGRSPSYLSSLGHKQQELIRECEWKGVDCTTGKLSVFWSWGWNYRYGNCYSFNNGVDDLGERIRILKSSKPGPSQGLVLQLNIEDHEYLGELSEEAGVRVVLHEPGSMYFPFEEGFSVTPGMATSVGLTKTFIKRLDRFDDGSCSEEGVPLAEDNLYRKHSNTTRYSLQACLNSCLGASQLAMCDCAEAAFPTAFQPCDVFDDEKRKCLQMVKVKFSKDQLPCISECKRPCREEIYEKTISASQWPSPAFEKYMIAQGLSAPNASNGLLLNIFYSQLNYQVIEETFSYGTTNLLADIGGQLGLWIGISALTCGEILELIFQLLALVYTKFKNRKQNRVVEIGQTTE